MRKKFRITINGETYEVEVEDLGGDALRVAQPHLLAHQLHRRSTYRSQRLLLR